MPRAVRGLALFALMTAAACGPATSPTATKDPGSGTMGPAATPSPAATAAPASAAPTAAATTAGCADTSGLKAALDALRAINPDSASKADMTAAAHAVGQAAALVLAAGGKAEHLAPLQFGDAVTEEMIANQSLSEAKQSIQMLLNTGDEALQELGACP